MKKTALVLAIALSTALSLFGANIVRRIQVIDLSGTANQDALEQIVHKAIATRVGEEFSPSQLSKDVAALVKTKGIDDVQTKTVELENGAVQVTFMVTIRQRIAEIAIRGNNEFSYRTLKTHLKTKPGEMLDEQRQAADRKAILSRYEKGGFYGTTVTQEITPAEGKPNQVVLTYVVVESTRAKLKGTAFKGNTAFTESELSRVLMTKRQWWRYIFRFGNYYKPSLRSLDIERITDLYATKGYLDAQVIDVEENYIDEEKKWIVPTYVIDEGMQYTIGELSIEGNEKFSAQELLAKTALKKGEIYNKNTADADLAAMKAPYEAQGHLDLRFHPELRKDDDAHVVDIIYHVFEGEPSRINEITITGNTYTRDHVIRRELAIFEDDLADNRKSQQTKNRLNNLGYFESVEIVPKATENPARRDLSIELKKKPTGSISVGAAFSSEDSVIGFLELSERNFSLSKLLNFEKPKGDGQRMRAYLAVGSNNTSVNISLLEPSLFDSPFQLNNEIFINTRYEDEYDERHIGYGLTLSWPVAFQLPFIPDHTEYWDMSIGLRLEQIAITHIDREERFDEEDGSYPDDVRFPQGMNYSIQRDKGDEFTNRLFLSLSRDRRDHFLFPTRGTKLSADAEYITKALGSYADYFKLHLGAEAYLPVYQDVFLRLAADGYTNVHVSGKDVKLFDRYFAGGIGTIRGFKRHDVSPVNRNENSIGGQTMFIGTAELIKPVQDFMFLKLFCDVGNVWWDDNCDYDFGDLNASIGLGIQFRQVPVRLDYGYPIITKGDHLDGRSGRFHFSIDYRF
ncbi:MAG: outer membrane protein assembly factor BamA [Lentisphaeria bacterium]|nr:outer membrane protein assembly factor BamA [Lentisphaeria bacterium]